MADVTGRRSETEGSEGIREIWGRAKQIPPSSSGGEWVPWRVIKINFDILPRTSQIPNTEMVRQYVEVFDELPPIKVQRDTFVLIDGLHRLTAAAEAQSDFVRIVEDPVSDAELWIAAFEENALHGVPLTTAERVKAAKRRMLTDPNNSSVAKWAGVHRSSVIQWRRGTEPKIESDIGAKGTVGIRQSDSPPSREVTRNATHEPSSAPEPPSAPEVRVGPSPAPKSTSAEPVHGALSLALAEYGKLREWTPESVAEDVQELEISSQIAFAWEMEAWWKSYAEALDLRLGVPV